MKRQKLLDGFPKCFPIYQKKTFKLVSEEMPEKKREVSSEGRKRKAESLRHSGRRLSSPAIHVCGSAETPGHHWLPRIIDSIIENCGNVTEQTGSCSEVGPQEGGM